MHPRPVRLFLLCSLIPICFTCTANQPQPGHSDSSEPQKPGEKALATAQRMIGKPYKLQASGPDAFDCSGLVRYSYLSAGMSVPRSTRELKQAARAIRPDDLRKGDLVFFERSGSAFSHVGIYAGGNSFVHAPRPGKTVRTDSLHDPYWKNRLSGAGRFDETAMRDSAKSADL